MIRCSTQFLSVDIDPKRGGAITGIRSASTGDEWIYFDPKRRPEGASLENYDEVWCGGFEELFPNDAAGMIDGRSLRDHGELWQQPWDVIRQHELGVTLSFTCSTVPAVITKEIRLNADSPSVSIEYSIQNKSGDTFPYLFKLHPAMRIEAGDTIVLPGGMVTPVSLDFSTIIGSEGPFSWPMVKDRSNAEADLSVIPEQKLGHQEFIYVKDLPDGSCGLKRKTTGEEFIIDFPQEIFPYTWMFMALGGWREYYTVVLEPCTNFPKDMTTAIANGTCAVMKPNEQRTFSINISVRSPHE